MRKAFLLFFITSILIGCSKLTGSPIGEMNDIISIQKLKDNQLFSHEDETLVELFLQKIEKANQLIEELNLLIEQFEKTDEFQEAIEMMDTARKEAQKIAEELSAIHFQTEKMMTYKASFEKELLNYANGLEMQIDGIENWDSKKITDGFKQTELAKTAITKLIEQL